MSFKIDLTIDITDNIVEEIKGTLDDYLESYSNYSYNTDIEFNSKNLEAFFNENKDVVFELIEANAAGELHVNPYVEHFLTKKVIERKEVVTSGEYTWYCIEDIDDIVEEGLTMENAAQDIGYAKMLSELYTLYYLKDKDMKTVVNAGYTKDPDGHLEPIPLMTPFIAVGLSNEPVLSKYKNAINQLQKTLGINEHVNYKMDLENTTIIDFEDGYKWVTINDVDDLMLVGEEMQNALMNKQFAIEYSGQMNLFFLKNKDEQVVINGSFYKENNKMHMVKEKYNGCPDLIMKPYIDKLFENLNITEESSDVLHKDDDLEQNILH
jgi:hypothetical protein